MARGDNERGRHSFHAATLILIRRILVHRSWRAVHSVPTMADLHVCWNSPAGSRPLFSIVCITAAPAMNLAMPSVTPLPMPP